VVAVSFYRDSSKSSEKGFIYNGSPFFNPESLEISLRNEIIEIHDIITPVSHSGHFLEPINDFIGLKIFEH
jgi:hypothetical protein